MQHIGEDFGQRPPVPVGCSAQAEHRSPDVVGYLNRPAKVTSIAVHRFGFYRPPLAEPAAGLVGHTGDAAQSSAWVDFETAAGRIFPVAAFTDLGPQHFAEHFREEVANL